MVSGLELLALELVTLGDASEMTVVLARMLGGMDMETEARSLGMGLTMLAEMVDSREGFVPSDAELATLAGLTGRCLESSESGVRMDAVKLCVALHGRVGDARFWEAMRGAKDGPKSLITYYVVKRQREREANGGGSGVGGVGAGASMGSVVGAAVPSTAA
jgi:CLIP-associating protein 1/2